MILLLLSCAKPETAPRDLDALIHAFWGFYEEGTDDEVVAAMIELDAIVEEDPTKGTYSDLEKEEAAIVDVEWNADPGDATGVEVTSAIDCTLDEAEKILASDEQDELYPDNYDTYEREYITSIDDYFAGDVDTVEWETTYGATVPIAGSYTTFVHAGQRRASTSDGTVILARTWMPNPAEATSDDLRFLQDYQIDVWWERGDSTANLFATWRQFEFGDLDPDYVVNLALGGMQGFQEDTEKICVEGRI